MKYKVGDIVKIVPVYNKGCVDSDAKKYENTITEIVKVSRQYTTPCYQLRGLELCFSNSPELRHIERWWEEGLLQKVK